VVQQPRRQLSYIDDDRKVDNFTKYKDHRWLERPMPVSTQFLNLAIIYECKDNCRTIIDVAHIKEMMKFTAHAVNDEAWARTCDTRGKVVDGSHCGSEAYVNLTHFVEPMINQITDLAIQTFISNAAKDKNNYNQMRVALDKDFTPANPYSKYLVSKLRFGGPVVESEWVFHDEVMPFYWQQVVTKNLT
jgi:hypothetical protein